MKSSPTWQLVPVFLLILIITFFALRLDHRNPLYVAKIYREKLHGLLVFGSYDKTLWHLTLANKRASETEKLVAGNDKNAFGRLKVAFFHFRSSLENYEQVKNKGENLNYLQTYTRETGERLLKLAENPLFGQESHLIKIEVKQILTHY